MNKVEKRSYGVDVSSFQGVELSAIAKAGAKFAIVKVSEGTGYQNPKAQAQVNSAIANGIMVSGYHYAHFGASRSQAIAKATMPLVQQDKLVSFQVLI